MKQCSFCQETKDSGDFYPHTSTKDRLQSRCKKCWKKKRSSSYEGKCEGCGKGFMSSRQKRFCSSRCRPRWKPPAPEKKRRTCPVCHESFLTSKAYRKYCAPACGQRQRVWRKYGFTPKSYWLLRAEQGELCAACLLPLPTDISSNSDTAVIDHNHETGVVRGIVHSRCNLALGCARDSPDVLRHMADYLVRSRYYRQYP